MKSIEYQFILRAESPIVQGQRVEGNTRLINRTPFVLADGSIRDIPEVTGNAMRSGLRRAMALLTLDTLGLLAPGSFSSPDGVRFLFNGGSGAGSSNTIKLDDVRAMNALIPSSALLGGSSRGMIHFGRLEVSPATLICEETMADLAPWQRERLAELQIRPSVVYETRTQEYQHDETAKPTGRYLLSDEAQRVLTERQQKRERAADSGDEVEADEAKGGMRPYSSQAIMRGALFDWRVVAHVHSELEEATFRAMVSAFLRRAVVGAGRRVGQGRFSVFAAAGFDHLRPAEAVQALAESDVAGAELEAAFVAHLQSRAEEARTWLLQSAG